MKGFPIIRVCWYISNTLLAVALGFVIYSAGWEFSTRSYLKGFSDAVIPSSDNSEQKVEAILAWMQTGPARRNTPDPDFLDARNPEDTLNYHQLLEVCGTATNAFVNLAQSSGLRARRLLLLDQNNLSKHVVVETLIDNRWIVVDPAFHSILRLSTGRPATREELRNPEIFRAATQAIPNYPSAYSYESTAHVRLARIPLIGGLLRKTLNFIWPSWEESINWTLLLERESFAMLVISIFLLCFALALRLFLSWYCFPKFGIARVRLRDQLVRAREVLLSSSK
jgi:transglutaminase superfamily protein